MEFGLRRSGPCITNRDVMPETPEQNPDTPKRTKTVDSLVRAEKLTQIAFIWPAAVVVGWLGGAGLDKWLHQSWIYLAGIVLGCVAGFVQIFRLVLGQEKQLEKEDKKP
jgi:F0F1-type ATP synthase assembly protein I